MFGFVDVGYCIVIVGRGVGGWDVVVVCVWV